jgi:hypothetical protein
MANPKSSSWYGASTSGITGKQPSAGSEFFVSGTGLDTNPGTRELPFLTITAAIAAAVAGNDDYIYVLGYAGAGTETWPIPMTKSKVHVIGTPAQANPSPLIVPSGDTDASARSAAWRSVLERPGLAFQLPASPGKRTSTTVGSRGRVQARMGSD